MKIKDKKYPSRLLCYRDIEIQFKDYVAEVPDKYGAELLATGEYEVLETKSAFTETTSNLFPFVPESWSKQRKLVLDSAIGYNNGYGKSGMMIAEGLSQYCDVYLISNKWVGYTPEHIPDVITNLIDKPLESIDTFYMQYYPAFSCRPLAKRQILYTMLECTLWPESWVDAIHQSCERLIVPCIAQKQAAIDSGIQIDIEVIPLGLKVEDYPILKRKRTKEDVFIFGIEGTLTYRKGVDVAIEAFKKAFPKEQFPDVGLFIKTTSKAGMYFMGMTRDDDRIGVNSEWFSPEDLLSEFYNKIDAYVFLSRGEGWGMTTMQAMSTGLPVIASDCSGIQDHVNNEVGYMVETKLVPVPNKDEFGNHNPFGYPPNLQRDGQMWWEPDLDSAVAAMREVYNNQKAAKQKGKLAAKHIRENFTHLQTGKKIVEYLDKKF